MVVGNLNHLGIHVTEVWYFHWATERFISEQAVTHTLVAPILVVGLDRENDSILNHRFVHLQTFDPLAHPNGPYSRFTHYVLKQGN